MRELKYKRVGHKKIRTVRKINFMKYRESKIGDFPFIVHINYFADTILIWIIQCQARHK